LSLFGRGSLTIAAIGVAALTGAASAEDLDAKKTGPQLFESTCSACHRSPHGLAKGQSASSLVSFLRQHYTTGPGPAGQLAAYLMANPGDGRAARPVPAAAKPEPQERQPVAHQAGPTPEAPATTTRGRPSRTARKPAEGPASEPVPGRAETLPGRRSPGPGETKPPVSAEASVPSVPPVAAAPVAVTPPAAADTPSEASTAVRPTEVGDQSAFSSPTP